MKRIKVYATCFWQDDLSLLKYLHNYGTNGFAKWKNIEFTIKNDFDIVVILTAPHFNHIPFELNKAITFYTEPPDSKHHLKNNTSRISKVYCPEIFWMCNAEDIQRFKNQNYKKFGCLSSVTSEEGALEGHKKRLIFLYYLDKAIQHGFDLFGRSTSGNFFTLINNYKGEIANKLEALISYKYHLSCENSFANGYFSEKALQPILGETLCFYDGCTNIYDFLDEKAIIKINVHEV